MPSKGKGQPATGRGGPRASGLVKAPDFLTFVTTRVVGRQPYAPAAFTPGEIPGTHFQGLNRPRSTWGATEKIPSDTTGTVRLVVQCLNHYATPGHPPVLSSSTN